MRMTQIDRVRVALLAWGLGWAGLAAAPSGQGEKLWSLTAVQRPAIPRVEPGIWVRNPIDAFLLKTLQGQGLAPAPEADRRTLIRRLSFDLTGLPPTPEEVEAFEG